VDVTKPSIYEYNDYRQFLSDWYDGQPSGPSRLSKSEISRRLGLPNTRSYFTDVLAGRTLTSLFADRFVELLDLDREEAQFFRVLVRFGQAATPEERELEFDQLVSLNRSPHRETDLSSYAYYRHWWNGALRALFTIEDHSDDYESMARRIQPRITSTQARQAVDSMSKLGIIHRDPSGYWKPLDMAITANTDFQNQIVRGLQMQQFDLVRQSILQDAPGKDISTSTISVSAVGMKHLVKRIDKFRSEVRSIVHKDPQPPDRVVLLDLALIRLTETASEPIQEVSK